MMELAIEELLAGMPVDPDAHLDHDRVSHYLATIPADIRTAPERMHSSTRWAQHSTASQLKKRSSTFSASVETGPEDEGDHGRRFGSSRTIGCSYIPRIPGRLTALRRCSFRRESAALSGAVAPEFVQLGKRGAPAQALGSPQTGRRLELRSRRRPRSLPRRAAGLHDAALIGEHHRVHAVA
jgi:hypothetical protein